MCTTDYGTQRVLRVASLKLKLCPPEPKANIFRVDGFLSTTMTLRNCEMRDGKRGNGAFWFTLTLSGSDMRVQGDEVALESGPNILESLCKLHEAGSFPSSLAGDIASIPRHP